MPREPLYPHKPKSRQPQFPHVPKGQQPAERLPQTLPQTGTCYADAWRFLIKEEEGELIHGTVQTIGKRINHAWVETETGYIWEPESGEFMKKAYFYERAKPKVEARYTAEEAAIMVARTKNHGPWTEQERRQYLGAVQPQTIELLASTEGDPIRKFCCRQCGECAPKELLAEGMFLDRISWLRSHYQTKHPGMWGKRQLLPLIHRDEKTWYLGEWWEQEYSTADAIVYRSADGKKWLYVYWNGTKEVKPVEQTDSGKRQLLPQVEGGEPVPPQYRHLVGLVSEPLPKEAE